MLHDKYPNSKLVFIEDAATNILKAEENDEIKDFVIGYHISSLLKG